MISFLVCSRNPVFLQQLKENLQRTVAYPYELLVWDNTNLNQGICEVYNKLALRAKFDLLCFLHEDVIFKNQDWTNELIDLFSSNSEVGVIGLAGSKYKARSYSGWYSHLSFLDAYNIIHKDTNIEHVIFNSPQTGSASEQVVCIDGVFIACRKIIWEQVKFNDILLKGFHLYDIDFSLRANKICNVVVSLNIDLIHFTSGGSYSNEWVNETINFHKYMESNLPASLPHIDIKGLEIHIAKMWLDRLKNETISWHNKKRWILSQKLYIHISLWYSIIKFIFYKPLSLYKLHNLLRK